MASEKKEASPEASPLKGPAPKAEPEDTSDVQFEDGIPLSPMAGDQTVQFMSATPANGDAKVEIGDSGTAPTFVGLGKEELMKYANDPFWIKLRWLLFILFWLLWVAMLVGAIVIIVYAPRCAEKKSTTETFYQMKAGDVIKDGKFEEHTKYLQNLGVETVIITEALLHEPGNPEAVTDYNELNEAVEKTLFKQALEGLKDKGIKILLQFVPNHSGTNHSWFHDMSNDFYIRRPFESVEKSVWMRQNERHTAWSKDPHNVTQAYLQQFSGNVADLNFGNDAVVDAFKETLGHWKDQNFDGFVISKASFLVEDLNQLMNSDAMRNQPDNVKILSKMIGITAPGPNLVELDNPSEETIKQYIDKGLTPIIKSVDITTVEKLRDALEELNKTPKAVIDLSKASTTQEKSRAVNLLASAAGSHTILNHANAGDIEFLKKVIAFQKDNPRGKAAEVKIHSEGQIIAILRTDGDEHLIIANLGEATANFTPEMSVFNSTSEAKGVVELVTPNAQQKFGESVGGTITLPRHSGVVIKLDKKEEAE